MNKPGSKSTTAAAGLLAAWIVPGGHPWHPWTPTLSLWLAGAWENLCADVRTRRWKLLTRSMFWASGVRTLSLWVSRISQISLSSFVGVQDHRGHFRMSAFR